MKRTQDQTNRHVYNNNCVAEKRPQRREEFNNMRFSNLKNDTSMNRASRLNDKDVETLSKALYYSKKAYEEVLLAKESSF
ncbi:hypothetical protein RhiirC2_847468 [Rhizophagus irregularis]|uniref:Uncharacterized protein n=1 Tax=Rhizophagus irregularis TaxID=588596 RepID=A0A2N1NID2_9GLOM|nr:hypothetical protein RhiirC2_847468 [Rhizophagus irregularis]